MRLTKYAYEFFQRNMVPEITFLSEDKTFDKVWHESIVKMIHMSELFLQGIKLIDAMLNQDAIFSHTADIRIPEIQLERTTLGMYVETL